MITESQIRKAIFGVASVILLGAAGSGYQFGWIESLLGSKSAAQFAIAGMVRVGLVCGAIWLAFDSLKRPARWLPPGLAAIGVLLIVVIAAQPKLILVLAPAIGVLATLGAVVRAFRKR
ncbi:MAG: hypothetical protein AB8B91_22030 [Rubripirellula sp.]